MPVRYIGKEPFFKGRALFEICRQLRDLGVGRVVYRTSFLEKRWPNQTTYVRLTKVIPDMTCPAVREPSIAEAWGYLVYRGKEVGEVKLSAGHKPDWALVPKDEEASFCEIKEVSAEESIPSSVECPPLLKAVLEQELKARNEVPEKLEIPYISKPSHKEVRRLLL